MDTRTMGDGAGSLRRKTGGGASDDNSVAVVAVAVEVPSASSFVIVDGDSAMVVAVDGVAAGTASDGFSCLTICNAVNSFCRPFVACAGDDIGIVPLLCASRAKACRYCCRLFAVSFACCFAARCCIRASRCSVFSARRNWAVSCVSCCFCALLKGRFLPLACNAAICPRKFRTVSASWSLPCLFVFPAVCLVVSTDFLLRAMELDFADRTLLSARRGGCLAGAALPLLFCLANCAVATVFLPAFLS